MASASELSRKPGTEEEDDDESRCHQLIKEGTPLALEEPEEVPLPPPYEPEEVPPPPLDEAMEVPLPPPNEPKEALALQPEEVLALQPMVVVRAPPLNADKATWSVSLFSDAFMKLGTVAIHLGVPVPNDTLQRTVKDYAFKIYILFWDLERGVLDPIDHDGGDDGSLDGSGSGSSSDSDSDGGAPPAVTISA
jgi:hypothetical protein